uniref:4Fe-4S ferredoxin-type domain-containing protein n=1 Tax=Arundo donax TaxID=35708 RepID=A0A0A9AA90_ARUDO
MTMSLFIMLIGGLAFPTMSVRPQPREVKSTVVATNSTSLDESKIYVILCIPGKCNYFSRDLRDCYCCPDGSRVEYCHVTMKECRAKCDVCNSICPTQLPLQSAMGDRPVHDPKINITEPNNNN